MTTTPASLLQRLRSPDPPASDWERFVRLYAPLLHGWAVRAGMQEADASDLVQDVLVHLMQKLPAFEYDPVRGGFRGWLHTVLMNRWRETMRRKAPVIATVAEPAAPPADGLEEAEHRQYLLGRALQLMKADFQENTWRVFWMTAIEGVPVAEAAARIKVSVKAVYLARARVLRRLREELAGLLE
jgi:RNA polymerase sigma-70 factor (ECF subfamily)